MAKKNFNLSVYQITLNIRREREKLEVLSDFDNGNDLLSIISELLESWKFTITSEAITSPTDLPLIQNDIENEKVFRIMKQEDGTDFLYPIGRYVTGIIESGDYGTEEHIVNILTGKASHTKKINESVLFPFYFMFYLPENSNLGFLIIERIGNIGIYSLLDKKLKEFVSPRITDNCILKIRPLVIKKLVDEHLKYVTGGAKKIIFEKVRKEDLHVSKLSKGQVSDEQVDSVEVVYNAKRNHPFNISDWFNKMIRKDDTSLYVVEDIEYEDISFEISVQGSKRKVSIKEIEKLGTYMDITESVVLAKNNYPTYKSINHEAHLLISYIKEQFENEKDSEPKSEE